MTSTTGWGSNHGQVHLRHAVDRRRLRRPGARAPQDRDPLEGAPGESFTFSWEYTAAAGSGHRSIWIHPTIPLQFDFQGSKEPRLNRAWVEELARLSNTPAGLRAVPEPAEGDGG